jgi:AcrR family transcriptional regulator
MHMTAESPTNALDNEARRCFIEAFKKLYPANGMRGISGAALAKRAGYSRSTFYRDFESVYDVLRLVEIEATPYQRMKYLLDHADSVGMREITDGFLQSFQEREDLIRMLVQHEDDNRYRERLHDCFLPVFRAQAERVFIMEPGEYDVLAEYITHAKLGLLRIWALDLVPLGLGHMTQITDSVLESSMWTRVEAAARAKAEGRPFERTPLSFFQKRQPWIQNRPMLEP